MPNVKFGHSKKDVTSLLSSDTFFIGNMLDQTSLFSREGSSKVR